MKKFNLTKYTAFVLAAVIIAGISGLTVIKMTNAETIKAYSTEQQSPGRIDTGEIKPQEPEPGKFIKWAQFDVPYDALDRGYKHCIKVHNEGGVFDWIELFALLAVKYYGNWGSYKSKDLENLAGQMKEGTVPEKYYTNKNYSYYYEVYTAVLGGYVGSYKLVTEGEDGVKEVEKFGLKVFNPVAEGRSYRHCDDFGNARGYGFKRRHLGHDLMGSTGTPIVAVESGYIEEMGWNQYGGWRVGIRSHDKKRYYYYAHLRKDHPFNNTLKKGDNIQAGDVIGYLGQTGYSTKENTNNIKTPHLHFGIQLVFDESQKEALCELWIDCYAITRFLHRNRSTVRLNEETKEYERVYKIIEE